MRYALNYVAFACLSLTGMQVEARTFAYVTNQGNNNVSVIDTNTNLEVGPPVSVGSGPMSVAANSAGTRVYVANSGSGDVSVIDTATSSVIFTTPVGSSPRDLVVNSAGTKVYVANSGTSDVSVIDTLTNSLIATVGVGSNPDGIAINPAGTRVYTANNNSSNVSVIDTSTNTVIASVPVSTTPSSVVVNSAGTHVYVASSFPDPQYGDDISVIDAATNAVVATVSLGGGFIESIAINPAGTRVYAMCLCGFVYVIDTTTNNVIAAVPVTGYSRRVAVNPTGTFVYVATGAGQVLVIDASINTVVAAITLGAGDASSVAFSSGGPPPIASATNTIRVSSNSTGVQGNKFSGAGSISANGRYVAFESSASNLVSGDSNNVEDIFVRDILLGNTTRASVANSGAQAGDYSYGASISADGRFVAFASAAGNLVAGETNASEDVFVRDTVAGTTSRVSVDNNGVQTIDGGSHAPSITADGRYVAFESTASNLVAGDTNNSSDVFFRDTVAGTTSRISVSSNGDQGNGYSSSPSISADGRYVAFASQASNLVAGDVYGSADIFVRDILTNTTSRVSVSTTGLPGNGASSGPSICAGGRYVAFFSAATNLVLGDTNGFVDVFVHDTVAETTFRANLDSAGFQANGGSSYVDFGVSPKITADGRFVTFESTANNLVAGDTNSSPDIFIRNILAGATTRVSVDSAGMQSNGLSGMPTISPDGRYVVLYSYANNLVPGDSNSTSDTFRIDVAPQPVAKIPTTPVGLGPGAHTSPGPILPSSAVLLSWNLVPDATYYDLGVRDMASGALVVNSTSTTSTFSTPPLAPGRAYKWNVAACNSLGCSKFAQAEFFQTPAAATIGPTAPEQISPGYRSGAESTYGSQVTLTWSPVLGAGAYSVGLFDVTAGALVPISLVTGGTTSTPITMETGHAYRWDVASCINDSVNDDANCPNRSDDLLFMQGDGTAFLDVPTAAPTGGIPVATVDVDSLVLVTHGWNSDSAAWPDSLASEICVSLAIRHHTTANITPRTAGGLECTVGRWRVISFNWSALACKGLGGVPLCTPNQAARNASTIGGRLGKNARATLRYKSVHLIAHSAGSELIQQFADRYNCEAWWDVFCPPAPRATIHMTFLDAFCPNVSSCRYGENADWAEQYVDSRLVGFGPLDEMQEVEDFNPFTSTYVGQTNVTLSAAVNFDVTALDKHITYPSNALGTEYHAFPYRQYSHSAGVDFSLSQFNATTIESFHRGAVLAAWNQVNAADPSFDPAAYIKTLTTKGVSGRAYLNPPAGSIEGIVPILNALAPVSTYLNTTVVLTPVANSCGGGSTATTLTAGTCTPPLSTSLWTSLSTAPDPGMVLVSATLSDFVDRLSFDFTFTSAANAGYLQVFVDNALAFIVAADGDAGTLQHAGPIEIARLDPGAHELRVVVKSDTAESASVVISNIVFDRVALQVPSAPVMNTASPGNGQATVTFSEGSYNGGSPITGFTVTSIPAGGVDSQAGTLSEGHAITGLTNGTSYSFTVNASNAVGDSAASEASNMVIPTSGLGLSIADIALTEGNSGTKTGTFMVTLPEVAQKAVTFDVATSNGSAAAGSDYLPLVLTGQTIPAGSVSKSIAVSIKGDTIQEANETFFVNLANVSGASVTDAQALGTISNDDTLGSPALSISDVSVTEGVAGTSLATFTVNLSPASAGAVSYNIATSNGSAAAGSDYVTSSLMGETIAAGNSSKTFAVTINGDAAVEANETFTVTLSGAVGATVANATATGVISNDDFLPTPVLSIADVSVAEGSSGTSQATFTVALSQALDKAVTFNVATANGTATAGSDYVAVNLAGESIAAGTTSKTVLVTINGDATLEPSETFFVNLSNISGVAVADAQAIGTISNDDAAVLPIASIQGGGQFSPLDGTEVTTEGVVTAVTDLGYFLQTPDAEQDGKAETADGLFVASTRDSLVVGDRVRVSGLVQEARSGGDVNQLTQTQLVAGKQAVLSQANSLPKAVVLDARNAGADQAITGLERYEGMRVSISQLSVVAPVGGVIDEASGTVRSNGRFYGVAKGVARPFREPGISALERADARAGANSPVFDTNPERLLINSRGQRGSRMLSADVGDTVLGLVGVLGYGDGTYQVLPDPTAPLSVQSGATPKPVSAPTAAQATIGSFNLRRFFDDIQSANEPVLSPAAYATRLAKTANVVCAYARSPDILAVAEVENLATLSDLAASINGKDGNLLFPDSCTGDPGYRSYVLPPKGSGPRNLGFLVSTTQVRPGVPRVQVLGVAQAGATPRFRQRDGSSELLNERPPLILQARLNGADGSSLPITVIANHLSALAGDLSAPGTHGWATQGDYLRARREAQARALAQLVQARQRANPQEKLVVLGDFGASEFNEGHDDLMGLVTGREMAGAKVLRNGGNPVTRPLTNLTSRLPQAERYTDVREGNAQALSHVLVNDALLSAFPDLHLETVRINADFGLEDFADTTVPMRSADSDPQVLYLERR